MLSLVIPTLNEAQNLPDLLILVQSVLSDRPYEIIVVDDDSRDRTWEVAEKLAARDPKIRVLRRVGRRGLSTAVVEGFDMAEGDVLAVMDADGQHDPHCILRLLESIEGGATIAVASRYAEGGSIGGWGGIRLWMSRAATGLAARLPRVRVSDPMSGFFALRSDAYRSVRQRLRPTGFKILLEILAHLPRESSAAEVPMTFGLRKHGKSKMSLRVQMQFLAHVARLTFLRLRTSKRLPWVILSILAAVLGAALGMRVWMLRILYVEPAVRASVERTLREVTDARGWLLSDIALREVTRQEMVVSVRRHHRGPDETSCYRLPFDGDPQPCAES